MENSLESRAQVWRMNTLSGENYNMPQGEKARNGNGDMKESVLTSLFSN